jgi:putative ABC transport system substrate-binding protein
MYPYEEYVRDGGMMFYGPNQPDLFRRAAGYVDRILKGSNPADMPIELPERFDFVLNVKAARTLGITFLDPIVAQATEVIQ